MEHWKASYSCLVVARSKKGYTSKFLSHECRLLSVTKGIFIFSLRFARKQGLVNEDTVPKSAPQMSTGKNVDHIGSVEQTIELEEKGAPCTSGEPPKQEFCENATGTKQSEPCSANSVQFSAVCNQQKCAESQVCQETKAQYRLTTVM